MELSDAVCTGTRALREVLASKSGVTVVETPLQGSSRLFWLNISCEGGLAGVEVYIDNGETFYSVLDDVEWAPVPVGSMGFQADFMIERLSAKAAEKRAGTQEIRGLPVGSEWKAGKRGKSKHRYHFPPQGPAELELLCMALVGVPGLLVESARSEHELEAISFHLSNISVSIATRGDDLQYRLHEVRERDLMPVASPSLQKRFILGRVRAARAFLDSRGAAGYE